MNFGADPTLKNYENQTPLDLATAEDVKCLLMDAMAPPNQHIQSSNQIKGKNQLKGCTTTITNTQSAAVISNDNSLNENQMYSKDNLNGESNNNNNNNLNKESDNVENQLDPDQNSILLEGDYLPTKSTTKNSINYNVPSAAELLLLQKNSANVNEDNTPDVNKPDGNSHVTNTMSFKNSSQSSSNTQNGSASPSTSKKSIVSISSFIDATLPSISMQEFLNNLNLSHLIEMFEKEMISIDILAEMGHEELKQIGVQAYGHRHKLLKAVEKLLLNTATTQQKQNCNQTNSYQLYFDSNLYNQLDPKHKNITNYSQTTLIDLMQNSPEYELG